MMFFDIPKSRMPNDSTYYFNVLVFFITIQPQYAQEYGLTDDITEIWYTEHITDSRPYVINICLTDDGYYDLEEQEEEEYSDTEFQMCAFPHQVIEITNDGTIIPYDFIDFDFNDPWRID